MRSVTRAIAIGAVVWLSGIYPAAQGTDPLIGTWELNVAKSKHSPGPAPKSQTRTYAMAGQDIKATAKGVDGAGKPIAAEWTMNEDGKDRPLSGNPDADMVSLKRVDASTVAFTLKRAGKAVITGTRTISKDGKVMTISEKGTNAQGQTISNVIVFEKR